MTCLWDDDPDEGFKHFWRTGCGNHGSREGYKTVPVICPHCGRPTSSAAQTPSVGTTAADTRTGIPASVRELSSLPFCSSCGFAHKGYYDNKCFPLQREVK
jgi:hypothetical protein